MLSAERLREVVAWARTHGILVASDECYLELGWDAEPVSVLHPSVSGGSTDGVLAVQGIPFRPAQRKCASSRDNFGTRERFRLASNAPCLPAVPRIRRGRSQTWTSECWRWRGRD